MLEKQIRLEELLGREVTIHWYEGVALIQTLCRQLLAHEGPHDVFPTAAQILIASDGSVAAVHATGRTAVRTAAQLLGKMLGDDVPVRLRLIVSQATSADTAFPTLDEFSTALSYFERPDGHQLLRGLFERGLAAPLRVTAAESGSEPVEPQQEEQPTKKRPRSHLRLVVGATVAAACILAAWLGASTVDYNRLSVSFPSWTGSSAAARKPSPPRSKTSGVGTVGRPSSSSRGRTAEQPFAKSNGSVATTARPGTMERRTNAAASSARRAGRPDALSGLALLPLNPGASAVTSAAEFRPVFGETVEVTASEAGPDDIGVDGSRIYSRADAGVIPPRSVYPKLPSDPPGEPENRTILELVIGTNGLVERARLRSIPRDIHEFMLVSAAKAWIFEPATVDGLAVRYRHRVFLSLP